MKKLNLLLMLLLVSCGVTLGQSPIIGTWTGTYGTGGTTQTPNFFSLKFNADGTMQVLNQSGGVIAQGRAAISNNNVSGSYTYTGQNSPFSVAGVYNASNNTIAGTWGQGNSPTGGGGWIMTSKSGVSGPAATTIPFGIKGSYTKAAPSTKQTAATQPMQATPKPATGMVITGTVNTFSNPSNTIPMADGTSITVTLKANQGNLPTNLGGVISEKEVGRYAASSSDPSWSCEYVTKTFTATSDNFLSSEYSATSTSIFPGAIYTANDFLSGNRKAFEFGRNPIEIGVDNVLNTVGPTYRVVSQPTTNEINTAIASIANTMTGSGEDIKYRVYIAESDAEMALNAAVSGSLGGFSVSAAYGNRSREHVRILTIDATKTYFTTSVNLPANGYFSDKNIEKNNANLVAIKNVVYGCRVLANVIINVSNRQDEADFLAKYSGIATEAQGAFNYFTTHSNFESTVNAMVIGGPGGTTIFNAATLQRDIENLMARANYRDARPIAFTLTDINGNILGIQSATDQITVPVCTPTGAVYTLKNARIEVLTGSNDPKNDGSSVSFELYNAAKKLVAEDKSVNNIEFPVNSTKDFNLNVNTSDPNIVSRKAFITGEAHIFFTPVNIAFGWDEWHIRGIAVYMQFVDEKGAPHPGGEVRLRYDNLNIYLKKDRQRLVIPFSYDGATFSTGGPFQPSGTKISISESFLKP